MYQFIKSVGLAVCLAAGFNIGASAASLPQETFNLPDDNLAVTVASATPEETDPLESELTIWVGEIELQGRKTVWVELIDSYGEVIYDSEVGTNETHLLPDGRAIVVSSTDPATTVAKTDDSRVITDGQLVFTRRVVHEGNQATSIEFIESKPADEQSSTETMANLGETIWAKITAFFHAAATRVQVAWNWLFGTAQA
jgi:hypothetical protein